MQSVINTVKGAALGVAEYLTPVLKESKFRETGVITPEEFVAAGDHLVHHCPTWSWAMGDDDRSKPYLPPKKQYLITRNVPCAHRCKQMEYNEEREEVVEPEYDGGWIDTHHYATPSDTESGLFDLNNTDNNRHISESSDNNNIENNAKSDDSDDDQEPLDMDAYEDNLDDNIEEEIKTVDEGKDDDICEEENIVKTRTYDLHITYDKFYQTPRLWFYGYDEEFNPLTIEQVFDDVSGDYVKKTVTMDAHPHLPGPPMASIHPCKHAEVMKKLINTALEGGTEIGVHLYLIIFLKFVQSVIPTMEYDFTQNFTL